MNRWVILALGLMIAVSVGACDTTSKAAPSTNGQTATNGGSKVTPVAKNKDGKTVDAAAAPTTTKVDESIKGDLYPGLPLHLLKPADRKTFVNVAKAQLCPCEGAVESMDSCLQKPEKQCDLAVSAAMEGMQKVSAGVSERDALDAVGLFIDNAYKKHTFDLSDTPRRGKADAKVVIVEFADFECPFCNVARGMLNQVEKDHGDNVAIYFKQFPLSMHQHANLASAASLAAHKQGKFWPMYNLLFDNQKDLSEAKVLELAQALGLNMQSFTKDYKDAAVLKSVERDKQEGIDAQVNATPSFFINGRKFLGDKTPEGLSAAVAKELKAKK